MTAELRFEHDTVELQGEKISQHLEAPTSQVCPHLLVSGGGLRHEKKGKEIPNLSCSRKSQRSKLEGWVRCSQVSYGRFGGSDGVGASHIISSYPPKNQGPRAQSLTREIIKNELRHFSSNSSPDQWSLTKGSSLYYTSPAKSYLPDGSSTSRRDAVLHLDTTALI